MRGILCPHNRQLSICAVCAPIADAFYLRHKRPITVVELDEEVRVVTQAAKEP
jgi:hypothetical protein